MNTDNNNGSNAKKDNSFSYTYSAKDRAEIEKIRKKYVPDEHQPSTLERLRMLDKSVNVKGTVISLIIGIIGSLIMGTGMCCVMLWNMFAVGVAVGVVGIALVAVAYPVYSAVTRRERAKITPEIMRLTDELMK